jgi:hypothetical protein
MGLSFGISKFALRILAFSPVGNNSKSSRSWTNWRLYQAFRLTLTAFGPLEKTSRPCRERLCDSERVHRAGWRHEQSHADDRSAEAHTGEREEIDAGGGRESRIR